MKFTIHQSSRSGGRPANQDRVAYSYSRNALLLVLADGMGGHHHGEVAAQLAVKMLTGAFQQAASPELPDVVDFLQAEIMKLHDAIHQLTANRGLEETPKTTLVVGILQQDKLYCAHVGDSRLYHFRNGKRLFRTEDHSIVQLMLKQGKLDAKAVTHHPDRHKIYNCLGSELPPSIEISPPRPLQPGDQVLLCSDGLWAQLSDERMLDILNTGLGVAHSVPSLLDAAERLGGPSMDNLSAIGVQWETKPEQALTISTLNMALAQSHTILGLAEPGETSTAETAADLVEEDIERAIAEINAAIKRSKR
ncbi:protein phosphatase 2C domain-containing protein [Methylobacillus arboreus]|uniref:PP2C family protein-serine/threonine phosphatase n=1 Tax=Methylobacillus arboreus TaxID=755170 RepID=UPI001E31F67A|nr:protein phosphatase 2C domain-containing protein [Methylobacillus arboreus]MCB5191033.1 protein phosphatase 2C domain-containing protein [Methylobacillus arboreus]